MSTKDEITKKEMKETARFKNVFSSLQPLLIISRPFGFAPFLQDENIQWTHNYPLLIWNNIVIFLIGALGCFNIVDLYSISSDGQNKETIQIIIGVLLYCSAIISLINFTCRRKTLISALVNIDSIDQMVMQLGAKIPHSKIKNNYWKRLIIGLILTTIILVFYIFFNKTFILIRFLWLLSSCIIILISNLSILTIIEMVASRYQALNECLWDMRANIDEAPIKKFAYIYNNIGFLTTELSKVYGLNQLITLGSFFIFSAMWTFFSVDQLLKWHHSGVPTDEEEKFIQILEFSNNVSLTFIILFYILSLGNVSYILNKEARRMALLIHDLANDTQNRETRLKLIGFSKQLLDQHPQFTAAGFFPLDRPFCHSFITGLTTILVIMIQMSLSQSK